MSELSASPTSGLPAPLTRALDRVRARWLAVRVAEFPVLLIAVIAPAWLLQAAADRLLDLTWQTRLVLLWVDVAVALALFVAFAMLPWWRRITQAQAALLVEREVPEFRTALISAVELGGPAAEVPPVSRALVRRLVEDVSHTVSREDLAPKVVRAQRLQRFVLAMAGALFVVILGVALAGSLTPLLVKRILLSHAPFPPATQVVHGSGDLDLLAGADAPLQAEAAGVIPSTGKLIVTYPEGREETITVSPVAGTPARFAFTVKNVRQAFRYRFALNDGIGETHQVAVRFPPSLQEVRFVQVYPKYTGLPETVMSSANLRLLEGSKLRVEGTASAALRSATLQIKGAEAPVPLVVSGAGKAMLKTELTVPANGWKAFSVHLEDASGEASVNDPVYRVELITDQPPLAVLTLPKKESSTVVPQAKVPFALKVSDDFGLKRVQLRYRVFRPSPGGALEPAEDGYFHLNVGQGEKSSVRSMPLDLSRLVPPISPGCNLTVWAEAEDFRSAKPWESGQVTRSGEKTLVIVTEEQKRQELIEALGDRARDLERLYEIQRSMNEKTDSSLK